MGSKGFEMARILCRRAAESGRDSLELRHLELTELPSEILGCSSLRFLALSDNRLTTFPPEIYSLVGLERLDLSNNPLRELPDAITALQNLLRLNIEYTCISTLPQSLRDLRRLTTLRVGSGMLQDLSVVQKLEQLRVFGCLGLATGATLPDLQALESLEDLSLNDVELARIPPWVFRLQRLIALRLTRNDLRVVPPAIAALVNLRELELQRNDLDDLPVEIGSLPSLAEMRVDGCPLSRLPPEIVTQGSNAILAYLRDQARSGTRQWISKLLVVGQGGVGKTSLLRALRDEIFDPNELTTHGIAVRPLKIVHPTEDGVTMDLSAWDFGGQEIYHATHQFFLTNRSLFLLVWNARHGHEQGRLYYWLDTIHARAPESPILIIATHIDERSADLPLADIRKRYPQIVSHHVVSNKTADGIEDLREAIRAEAAKLPLMGERWPKTWLDAANAIRARAKTETHITPQKLWATMKQSGVADDRHKILATWLHELGDILFFQDKRELDDIVLLDPQWATKAISRVLECEEVIEHRGVFTRAQMNEIWSDVDSYLRTHLLRLMEEFDLSYRTMDDNDVSIVVERLSHDAPADLLPRFDALREQREIRMLFQLDGSLPAGIPTWFIAREHRFTTRTHYRHGALFTDDTKQHLALIQAFPEQRNLLLTVRGPRPDAFFTLLRDGLEFTLARFRGLKIERFIPCPGHDGLPCTHEFKFEQLQKALEKKRSHIQCPVAFGGDVESPDVDIREMLFGLTASTVDDVQRKLEVISAKQDEHLIHIRALTEIVQREFLRVFQAMQRHEETHCPSLFVLRPDQGEAWKQRLLGQTVELHLVCEAPGEAHLTDDTGRYKTQFSPTWLGTIAPHVEKVSSVLKYAAPLIGAAAGFAPEPYQKMFANDIKLMQELVKKLPEIEGEEDDSLSLRDRHGEESLERASGATLRIVRSLLDELDPRKAWGGLRKILTPEGHYLWLCDKHAAAYRV
ncbi:COR domain-containing protein [Polyangium sp. 15x6]|uniref:COR domain-containing protein n=1 Tax=Polyangium sp. 15x6 TaxID=3042687 RepID=UPI00249B4F3A|nr:COR domain-containing protein [Polyangium sp. 15x6]MDI3282150.1 COR domain-containing protein [Polyangium sp. 15x6]